MSIYDCRDQIKKTLYNNRSKVVQILKKLGCHKINPDFAYNEIRCALPNHTNPTSVSVLMNKYINCQVFSVGDYDSYIGKDIISLTQYVLNTNFEDAIKWLCGELQIEFNGEFLQNAESPILDIIDKKKIEITKSNNSNIIHTIQDIKILDKYLHTYVQEWLEEGISIETQKKYKICINEKDMEYIIPIFDENGNLITMKARRYMPNIEDLGIPKYIHKIPIGRGNNDLIFGLNFNKEKVREKREIIIFEGEKSVMKADTYGYDWCGSVGKNGINPRILKKLLGLHCDIVLAFDKDVEIKRLRHEAEKLSMFTNVFFVLDKNDILDKKDSPVDKGKEVWEQLYSNKIRFN